ncbi:hypothetical protein LCGC14_1349210 [marine sediment metagenome]|uniref:Uncharacterized protein n=1 Tax=marine sediment metagenome TaxID=412755 RepID=A0A0F9KBH7_9ZZZZ
MLRKFLNLFVIPYILTAIKDHRKLPKVRAKLAKAQADFDHVREIAERHRRGGLELKALYETQIESMKFPTACYGRGCVAMVASDTVYASRMLRSIDRDIAEEKDGKEQGSNPG